MTMQANRRILVIDDNRAIHEDFKKILADRTRSDALDARQRRCSVTPSLPNNPFVPGLIWISPARDRRVTHCSSKPSKRTAICPGVRGHANAARLGRRADHRETLGSGPGSANRHLHRLLRLFLGRHSEKIRVGRPPPYPQEAIRHRGGLPVGLRLTEKWHLAKCAHLKLNQLRSMVEEQTRTLQTEIAERSRSEQALAPARTDMRWWRRRRTTGCGIGISNRTRSIFLPAGRRCSDTKTTRSLSAPDGWFSRVEPEDTGSPEIRTEGASQRGVDNLRCEYRIRHKDGKPRWMLCRGLAVRDKTGKAVRIAGSQTDITDRKLAEEQLRKDAWHDALTGLANRAMLANSLEHCMMRSKRDQSPFAVLFFDLDRFKLINDSLGHLVGDQLLIAIAKRLTTCVRELDMVARVQSEHIVRLGGDEFVILLEKMHEPADAIRVAERIQSAFTEPFILNEHTVFASGSIGIALSNPSYRCFQDILRDADTALYQAKAAGQGGLCDIRWRACTNRPSPGCSPKRNFAASSSGENCCCNISQS